MRRFWRVMVAEFDVVSFPIDAVAFEAVNEPGNFNSWGVQNRAADLMMGFALLVADAQPGRVLIIPAEMGVPRCSPSAGPESQAFVQSWESILQKRPGNGADSLNRFSALRVPVVGTFHFYDPRQFTHQPRFYGEQAASGHVRWDVAHGGGRIRMIFDAVRAAVPQLPFYVGEFGLDLLGIAPGTADGAEWLRAVRRHAQDHAFAFALWTYYTSHQGVVDDVSARERLRQWDCSPLAAAVFNFSVGRPGAAEHAPESCGGLAPFSAGADHSDEGGAAALLEAYSYYSYDADVDAGPLYDDGDDGGEGGEGGVQQQQLELWSATSSGVGNASAGVFGNASAGVLGNASASGGGVSVGSWDGKGLAPNRARAPGKAVAKARGAGALWHPSSSVRPSAIPPSARRRTRVSACDDGRPWFAPEPTTFLSSERPPCSPAPPPFVIPPPSSGLAAAVVEDRFGSAAPHSAIRSAPPIATPPEPSPSSPRVGSPSFPTPGHPPRPQHHSSPPFTRPAAHAPPLDAARASSALLAIGVMCVGAVLGMTIALATGGRLVRSFQIPSSSRSRSWKIESTTTPAGPHPGSRPEPKRVQMRQVRSFLPPLAMAMARGRRKKGHRKLTVAAETCEPEAEHAAGS